MQVFNIYDEQGRLKEVKFYHNDGKVGQYQSHTISYLHARTQLKEELGEIMGLDLIVENEKGE